MIWTLGVAWCKFTKQILLKNSLEISKHKMFLGLPMYRKQQAKFKGDFYLNDIGNEKRKNTECLSWKGLRIL